MVSAGGDEVMGVQPRGGTSALVRETPRSPLAPAPCREVARRHGL